MRWTARLVIAFLLGTIARGASAQCPLDDQCCTIVCEYFEWFWCCEEGGWDADCAALANAVCPGVCCIDEQCFTGYTRPQCEQQQGSFYLGDQPCSVCEPVVHACCLAAGDCTYLTQAECEALNGYWSQADDLNCNNWCRPEGACCLPAPEQWCAQLDDLECAANGGTFHEGQLCADVCTGGCCMPDGTCDEMLYELCWLQHGEWVGSDCSVVNCDRDQDLDGLPDHWEMYGIPYVDKNTGQLLRYRLDVDHDGVIDARVDHRDLFVEVDAMTATGLAPAAGELDPVIDAFEQAPVTNPDGTTGIALHLDLDEDDLATQDFDYDINGWDVFHSIKSIHFGTPQERADGGAIPESRLLDAKAQAYRYCIFGRAHIFHVSVTGRAEVSEFGGNDFYIALGANANNPLPEGGVFGGTPQKKQAIFMHELGHTLGLSHYGPVSQLPADERHDFELGFGRKLNRKPNYMSVMNYVWTLPKDEDLSFEWRTPGSWRLDYSRVALPTLNEADLDEQAGLVGNSELEEMLFPPPGFNVPYNLSPPGDPPDGKTARLAFGVGVDWNRSTVIEPHDPNFPVTFDLNRLLAIDPEWISMLSGQDDWSHLVYSVRSSPYFANSVSPTPEHDPEEIGYDDYELLSNLAPPICLGDVDGNDMVDVFDLFTLLAGWGPCDPIVACVRDLDENGEVGVSDLMTLLHAWGACE